MKRIVWLLTLVLTLSLVLTGCQKSTSQPAPVEDRLQIGMVFDSDGEKNPFFIRASQGLERAQAQFGTSIQTRSAQPTTDTERIELARQFAKDGYDLVICVGSLFIEELPALARQYPTTHFALIDNTIPNLTVTSNISCISFREQEGSFLTGAMAALMSKTGTIGFVGGMAVAPVERLETGYSCGARYINPNIKILSEYVGTTSAAFNDPARGKAIAQRQLEQGADVIMQAAGISGDGVIEAVSANRKLAIGVDIDQSLIAPEDQREYILTSMEKKLDEAVFLVIQSLVQDRLQGGYTELGLKEDCLDYSHNQYNQELISDLKPKIEKIKAGIISGDIKVPGK